jgi:hypothetical protein
MVSQAALSMAIEAKLVLLTLATVHFVFSQLEPSWVSVTNVCGLVENHAWGHSWLISVLSPCGRCCICSSWAANLVIWGLPKGAGDSLRGTRFCVFTVTVSVEFLFYQKGNQQIGLLGNKVGWTATCVFPAPCRGVGLSPWGKMSLVGTIVSMLSPQCCATWVLHVAFLPAQSHSV